MKLYKVINNDYPTMRVVANDMCDALIKYRKHLDISINADYSADTIFQSIRDCEYIGEYEEAGDLIK